MKIKDIEKEALSAPTFMGVEQELILIDKLSKVPLAEIEVNKSTFFSIIDRLDESHSNDGYFGVNSDNINHFLRFASWLESIAKSGEMSDHKDDLTAYAEAFRVDPKLIYSQ